MIWTVTVNVGTVNKANLLDRGIEEMQQIGLEVLRYVMV